MRVFAISRLKAVPFFALAAIGMIGAIGVLGALFVMPTTAEAQVKNPHSLSALSGSLDTANVVSGIKSRIARLDVSASAKLFDLDIVDGVNMALRYRYKVEPSYKGEYSLRSDRWSITADINPGDMSDDFENKYIGLNLHKGAEVLFVRPFKSKRDALLALPYTPARIPFTARGLADKLAIGDFMAVTADMNLVVSASTVPVSSHVPVTGWTHFLLSGEFQVHLFRASDSKIRMKLIALRRREVAAGVTVGYKDTFKITGLKIVNRTIERALNLDTDILSLSFSKESSKLVMADYVLDLKDSSVADAYDAVMSSALTVKKIAGANPFSSASLNSQIISDMTPVETIFQTEKIKAASLRSVDRMFKGTADTPSETKTSFKFNLALFKYTDDTQFAESDMTATDENDNLQYFKFLTYYRNVVSSRLFSYYKEETTFRSALLMDSNDKAEMVALRSITFGWDYRDKLATPKEIKNVREAIRRHVPKDIYLKIKWGDFAKAVDRHNARVVSQVVFHTAAVNAIGYHSYADLVSRLSDYLNTVEVPTVPAATDPFGGSDTPAVAGEAVAYAYEVGRIALRLSIFLNPGNSWETRSGAYSDLRYIPLFNEIASGFLATLLPKGDLQPYVFYRLSVIADGVKSPLFFEYGALGDQSIYDAAIYIQNVLNNRDIDQVLQLDP